MKDMFVMVDQLIVLFQVVKVVDLVFQMLLIEVIQVLCYCVVFDGKFDVVLLDEYQYVVYVFLWFVIYIEVLCQFVGWVDCLVVEDVFGWIEVLILQIGFGEYLIQIVGGILMSQIEFVCLFDLGLDWQFDDDLCCLMVGNSLVVCVELVWLMQDNNCCVIFGVLGLDDELEMICDQFCCYVDEWVIFNVYGWYLKDELIFFEIINELVELGVFGLIIFEEYGGLGLLKVLMVVVIEELLCGYIGVGSFGMCSEIVVELILCGGIEV